MFKITCHKAKGQFCCSLNLRPKSGSSCIINSLRIDVISRAVDLMPFSPKQFNHSSFYLIWRLNFPQSNIIDLQKILRLGKNSRWVKFPVTHTSHCPAEGLWRKCAITSSELCLFLYSHLILSLAMLWTVWQYHFKNPLEIHRQEYTANPSVHKMPIGKILKIIHSDMKYIQYLFLKY